MEPAELDALVAALESQASAVDTTHTEWKPLWESIRQIGAAFKTTRYPTGRQKQEVWARFQEAVAHIKTVQDEAHQQRQQAVRRSRQLKGELLAMADAATPPSGLDEAVYAMTFGVAEMAIRGLVNALLPGPEEDQAKRTLQHCSAKLRDAWRYFTDNKSDMFGRDKHEVFEALREVQEKLDAAWERYKRAKEEAWNARQAQRQQRREDFEHRVRANIEKLEERRDRLRDVLRHKESHLRDLEDKLSSARGEDYRDAVSRWISEEETAVEDITAKLREIERWIDEEHGKL